MFFSNTDLIKCDLCESKKNIILLKHKGKVMTSDQKIINSKIEKIQCTNCGLVRNRNLPKLDLVKDYSENYSYNTGNNEDIYFFNKTGIRERSLQVFDWIRTLVNSEQLSKIKTIIEVGCGEGNLLLQFKKKYPNKKLIGIEINKNAIKIGRKRGLDIRSLDESIPEKADLIISYAVIEHTTSPKLFLESISNMLNQNGLLLIGTPHQDRRSHDIFFVDHLFHFSSKHIQDLARLANFKLLKKSTESWPIDSFGIYLFELSKKKLKTMIKYRKNGSKESIIYYSKIFNNVNRTLKKIKTGKKFAVLGMGEFFSLLFTYTDLKKRKIDYGIDDYPKDKKFSFPIISLKEASGFDINSILLCVHPNYYKIILDKFNSAKFKIYFP